MNNCKICGKFLSRSFDVSICPNIWQESHKAEFSEDDQVYIKRLKTDNSKMRKLHWILEISIDQYESLNKKLEDKLQLLKFENEKYKMRLDEIERLNELRDETKGEKDKLWEELNEVKKHLHALEVQGHD